MKKVITILLALVMVFALCACGNSVDLKNVNTNPEALANSKYVGRWKFTEVEVAFAGKNATAEESGTYWTLDVRSDGTVLMDSPDGTEELNWGISNNGFTIISDKPIQLTDVDENRIQMKMLGAKFIFEHVDEALEPDVDAEADAETAPETDAVEEPDAEKDEPHPEEAETVQAPEYVPSPEADLSAAEEADEGADAVTH